MLSKVIAVLRFIRAPLVVTVWSHLLAGGLITLWMPLSLWTGFTCVYFFGMAHNDWVDRVRDKMSNPARPLPSGALSEFTARSILAFLGLGVAFSYLAATSNPSIGVLANWLPFSFVCALGYNSTKARFPLGSAFLLGAARASVLAPFAADYSHFTDNSDYLWCAKSATWMHVVIVGAVGAIITLWSQTEDVHPRRKIWTLRFLLALPLIDAVLVYFTLAKNHPATELSQAHWILMPILSFAGYLGVLVLRPPRIIPSS